MGRSNERGRKTAMHITVYKEVMFQFCTDTEQLPGFTEEEEEANPGGCLYQTAPDTHPVMRIAWS